MVSAHDSHTCEWSLHACICNKCRLLKYNKPYVDPKTIANPNGSVLITLANTVLKPSFTKINKSWLQIQRKESKYSRLKY